MPRSAWGVRVSVSVHVLLPGWGSVTPAGGATVAVLASGAVAAGSIVPVKVRAALFPMVRGALKAQTPPTYVPSSVLNDGLRIAAGTESVTVTLATGSGPLFLTV